MAITDSITHNADNMLFHGALVTSRAIENGDTAEYTIGSVTVTFDSLVMLC